MRVAWVAKEERKGWGLATKQWENGTKEGDIVADMEGTPDDGKETTRSAAQLGRTSHMQGQSQGL